MSSTTSDSSANSELAERVLAQFADDESERNLVRLYEDVGPPSLGELRDVVLRLLRANELAQVYRVHSPLGDRPGLEDFDRYEEIPESLADETQDPPVDFEIGIEDIEVVYRRPVKG